LDFCARKLDVEHAPNAPTSNPRRRSSRLDKALLAARARDGIRFL
jgi:hypothetical protein